MTTTTEAARCRLVAGARGSFRRWWLVTTRPSSFAAAWRLSGVIDAKRIPAGSTALAAAWWWANRTERVIFFALMMLAPTFLVGPLLWCGQRPTRRSGLYVVLAVLWTGLLSAVR